MAWNKTRNDPFLPVEASEAGPLGTPHSRRALIAGAVAAGAGIATSLVVSAAPAAASDGNTVTVGGAFTGDTTTSISTSGNGQSGVEGIDTSSGGGFGVTGTSTNGTGVVGQSFAGEGVHGLSSASVGVFGESVQSAGVLGITHEIGQAAVSGDDKSGLAAASACRGPPPTASACRGSGTPTASSGSRASTRATAGASASTGRRRTAPE